MSSTFNVLVVFAGALTFFLAKGSEVTLKSIGYIALPVIFSLMYLEVMSNLYENAFLTREVLRTERKLNNLCKDECLLMDAFWFRSHTKLSHAIFNPVSIRGWIFVLTAALAYMIASWWAFNSIQLGLRYILAVVMGISLLVMISSSFQALKALNNTFEFGEVELR